MSAPIDLEILKDDLNIPASDTSNDAWLQRRVDAIWSRMEVFCARKLVSPPSSFIDDWGEVSIGGRHVNLPPAIAYWPKASVFLRVFPVIEVTAVVLNGSDADAANVVFDNRSGKLLGLDGWPTGDNWDMGRALLGDRARVTYTAGFDEVPPDLYEVVRSIMEVQWAGRQGQLSGVGTGGVRQIDVMDVGSVQLGSTNAFVEATMKGVGTNDPLLGPWANNLFDYIDWRVTLGSDCMPTTKAAP